MRGPRARESQRAKNRRAKERGVTGRSQTMEGLIVPVLIKKIRRRVHRTQIAALRNRWIDGWGEISYSTVMCAAQDFCPSPQMCARDTDRGAVGGCDTRDQVFRGKLEVIEYLDVECSTQVETTMLMNLGQGERDGEHSDYVGHHLGGMVVLLPVTPSGDRSPLSFH